jgi:cytochrome P450
MCLREGNIYPHPDVYQPERFLDEKNLMEAVNFDTQKMGHVSYGYGRRSAFKHLSLNSNLSLPSICVGMHFANQGLLINIATMLWASDIKPLMNKDGSPMKESEVVWEDDGVIVWVSPSSDMNEL